MITADLFSKSPNSKFSWQILFWHPNSRYYLIFYTWTFMNILISACSWKFIKVSVCKWLCCICMVTTIHTQGYMQELQAKYSSFFLLEWLSTSPPLISVRSQERLIHPDFPWEVEITVEKVKKIFTAVFHMNRNQSRRETYVMRGWGNLEGTKPLLPQ